SLRPSLSVGLWPGGALYARGDVPLAWSREFQPGGAFEHSRTPIRIDQALLFQTFSLPWGIVGLAGLGLYRPGAPGGVLELGWQFAELHRFKLQASYAVFPDRQTSLASALAGYRFYLPVLDSALDLKAGQFLYGDR